MKRFLGVLLSPWSFVFVLPTSYTVTASATPSSTRNEPAVAYFAAPLSGADCSNIIGQIAASRLNQTAIQQLNQILDAIAAECGIPTPPTHVDGAAAVYELPDADFIAAWDGRYVTVGEKARATYDYTMPKTVRKVTLTASDIDAKRENRLLIALSTSIADLNSDVRARLQTIYDDGETNLILSGYAFHDPSTYSAEKRKELNAKAFGIGVEKVIRVNENGNKESLFAMIFFDSHNQLEPSAGYEWQKPFRITPEVKTWLGFSAGLTSRSDIFNRIPIPYVLPTLGLSVGKVALKGVFIPKLNGGVNHGDVLYLFATVPMNSRH